MDILARFLLAIVEGMKHDMNIYGFVFSLWDVFIFSALAGIVFWAIGRIFE